MRPTYNDEEDFRNDPLVRMAATIMDPLYGEPVPPTSVTAADLAALAARRHSGTVRRRWRWLGAPAFVAILVVIILTAANFVSRGGHRTPNARPIATATSRIRQPQPLPLRFPYPSGAPAARPELLALVTRVLAAGDGPTAGRYTYVHTQTWSADPAVRPHQSVAVRDEQLWWTADHSGRQVISEASAAPAGSPGTPAFGDVVEYRPGELAVVVDSPSDYAPVLASQLNDYQPFPQGPQAPLRAVVDMYRYHALDAAQRAAAVRVLADTTGLLYRGQVTDPAGRLGIAVSADSQHGAVRDVAVFDSASGRLLSYEREALKTPRYALPRTPTVIDYVLFLAAGHTDEVGRPPATPGG